MSRRPRLRPVGIFKTTGKGKPFALNPAGARMLGFSSSEEAIAAIAHSTTSVWFDPNNQAKYVTEIEANGEIRAIERRLKRRDGSPFWVSLSGMAPVPLRTH